MDKTPISDDYKRVLLKFGASPKHTEELFAIIKNLSEGYVWHDYDAGEDAYEDSHEGRWVKREEIVNLNFAKSLLEKFVDDFYGLSPKYEDRAILIQQTENFIEYKKRKEDQKQIEERTVLVKKIFQKLN